MISVHLIVECTRLREWDRDVLCGHRQMDGEDASQVHEDGTGMKKNYWGWCRNGADTYKDCINSCISDVCPECGVA